ncbi:hypothetical protein BDW62DRAFT_186520, partial [Aspergillus aurantiobrunneus]
MTLTSHLPTTTPLSLHSATTHPFLRLAGLGQIRKPLLSQWLSQDRLYAQTYVRFIGLLLAKVQLPSTPSSKNEPTIHEKILDVLIDALTNIRTELAFFEEVAAEYHLDLSAVPGGLEGQGQGQEGVSAAPITQAYIDMFMSAGSPGASLLEGLVVLWATEVCYLRAWRFAGSFLEQGGGEDLDGGALRKRFIPNWASEEFEMFVGRIGGVVDELARAEGEGVGLGKCERWWRQVVWLEERFWPVV